MAAVTNFDKVFILGTPNEVKKVLSYVKNSLGVTNLDKVFIIVFETSKEVTAFCKTNPEWETMFLTTGLHRPWFWLILGFILYVVLGLVSAQQVIKIPAEQTSSTSSVNTISPTTAGDVSRSFIVVPPGKGTLTTALALAKDNDVFILQVGDYLTNSNSATMPIGKLAANNVAIIGFGATINGENKVDAGIEITGKNNRLVGAALKNFKRNAVVIYAGSNYIQECYAYNCGFTPNYIGGAFRTVGPVNGVVFDSCLAENTCIGFELRENPTQNNTKVPPSNLPFNQFPTFFGYNFGAQNCVIKNCVVFNTIGPDEHADGIYARYASNCKILNNVAWGCKDDGFDLLASTRFLIDGNVSFKNAPQGNPTNGDGNGIKVGVRGGLYNTVTNNTCFGNILGSGIDMADTEYAIANNNRVFNNQIGIWFEGNRGSTHECKNNKLWNNSNRHIGTIAPSVILNQSNNVIVEIPEPIANLIKSPTETISQYNARLLYALSVK